MKVNVKILRGAECTLDVQPDLHILEFKKMIENNLKVPVNEQKLLLKGKLLLAARLTDSAWKIKFLPRKTWKADHALVRVKLNTKISDMQNNHLEDRSLLNFLKIRSTLRKYCWISEGNWKKLNDYDIKEDSKLNLVVLGSKESAPNTSKSPRKDILEIEMTKFLRRYFSDSDAKKISEEYMKEFYRKTSSCNLEDWERIATGYLNEEKSKQKSS